MDPADLTNEALLKKKKKISLVDQGMGVEGQDREAIAEEGRSPGARDDPDGDKDLEG